MSSEHEGRKVSVLEVHPDSVETSFKHRKNNYEHIAFRINNLKNGAYRIEVELVRGHGVLFCEGALEIILDLDMGDGPKWAPIENRVGYYRSRRTI